MTTVTSAPEIDHYEEDISPSYVFKRIYAFFYNKTVGVILILAMAIMAFFGTMIMQAPAGVFDDPTTAEQWLETARQRYGGWTGILDFLGFFHIYSSALFLIICAMLALSIIACTTHRLPVLWKAAMHPRVHVSDNFHRHAQNRTEVLLEDVGGTPDVAFDQATGVLKSKRWRILHDDRHENSAYADKNRFGPFGTALAHASFVLMMGAFVLTNTAAVEHYIPIVVGTTEEVPDTTMTVTAQSFQDTYNEDGRPIDYVSHLIVHDDGTQVGEQDVRVNSPLGYDGYRFHQTSYGIAAVMTVTNPAGESTSESVPLQWTSNDGTNSIGRLSLPGMEAYDVLVVTPASGRADSAIPPGSAMLEIYPATSNQPLTVQRLPQGDEVQAEGYTFTFEREAQYTGITARKDPAAILMWISAVLLVAGMWMTFGFPHRRLWIRADDGGLHISSVDKHDAIYEREYRRLVAEISNKEGEEHA